MAARHLLVQSIDMKWATLITGASALVATVSACGSSKSDFLNDSPRIDSANSGGSQGTSTAGDDGSGGTAQGSTTAGASSTTSGASSTGGASGGGASIGDTGTTGSSGTGGAPDRDCTRAADCGLATNAAECCAGCAAAYPKAAIASDPCLVAKGETDSKSCQAPVCTDVLCPAIACEEPVGVACKHGQCVASFECPEGTLLDRGSCVPPCTSNDDCVVATPAGDCCGGCPSAYHRQVVEADACLVPSGKPAPQECLPDQQACAFVVCPDVLCVEPGSAVCDETGVCAMNTGFTD